MLECQVAKRDPGVFVGSHLQSMSFLLGCGNFIVFSVSLIPSFCSLFSSFSEALKNRLKTPVLS